MDIPQFLMGIAVGFAIGAAFWIVRGYRRGEIRWK